MRTGPFRLCCAICANALAAHLVILIAVVAAVACSVGTQYGVKNLVDSLSAGTGSRRQRMAGIHFSHVADRRR